MEHLLTGRARERPLEILSEVVPGPKGDGASLGGGLGRGELRDERVVRVNQACQVTDERLEYSSPLLCEAASTIARSAVSSSLSPRDTAPNPFAVASFSAAFSEPLCVWTMDTSLTMKAPSSQSIAPDGRASARFRRTSGWGHFIHLRPETVTAAKGVPAA